MLIWSPLEQYSGLIDNLNRRTCDRTLSPDGWTSGCNGQGNPRLLHSVNTNAILISRVYVCTNQHRVLGHNPDIINAFTRGGLHSLVPFILWHKTGFTTALANFIVNMCESGQPIAQTECMLVENRVRSFYNIKCKFQQLFGRLFHFPEYDGESLTFWKSSPSRHSIVACYLHLFWQQEKTSNHVMSETSLSTDALWLSCDHTFKSS